LENGIGGKFGDKVKNDNYEKNLAKYKQAAHILLV